jgi:hypothetical protein
VTLAPHIAQGQGMGLQATLARSGQVLAITAMVPWHGTLAALARSGAGAGKGRVPYRL